MAAEEVVIMSDDQDFDPRILFEEKERLSCLPYFSRNAALTEYGVLLSDRIKYYCGDEFKLIQPFDVDFLRPAGYDLRVGFNYAIGGQRSTLQYGEKLTIDPYQVAVIQTLETLNIPDFLIGRWNIRVSLAYKGLLWVGGAQVDPGFRGRLSCPIYNLSKVPVELACGDKLAMIDFVTTTTFISGESQPFQWWDGKKLTFQQYSTNLSSGVADRLDNIRKELEETKEALTAEQEKTSKSISDKVASLQARTDLRIETFSTLVFTVVAVLFAGLGIVATRGSDEPSFVSSPVWVAVVALYFALKPYAIIWAETKGNVNLGGILPVRTANRPQWLDTLKPNFIEILVAGILVVGSLGFHIWHAHVSAKELKDEKVRVEMLDQSVKQQRDKFEAEIQNSQVRSDAKLQSLQRQIEFLKNKQ